MKNLHIGEKYNRWTIKEKLDVGWLIICDCGTHKKVRTLYDLISGKSKSCGCLKHDKIVKSNANNTYGTSHGASKEEWYSNWRSMINRFRSKGKDSYLDGHITGKLIEESWLENPWDFYKEIGEKPNSHYSIDRINNNLGYIIGNVKWSTPKQQANNRRVSASSNSGVRNIFKTKSGTFKLKVKGKYLGTFNTLNEAIDFKNKYKDPDDK